MLRLPDMASDWETASTKRMEAFLLHSSRCRPFHSKDTPTKPCGGQHKGFGASFAGEPSPLSPWLMAQGCVVEMLCPTWANQCSFSMRSS